MHNKHHHDSWRDAPPWSHDLYNEIVQIRKELELIMSTIDELVANVADEDTVIDSAVVLLGEMQKQIADLKTNQTDPATASKIDALNQDITAKKAALAAALVTNTPTPPVDGNPVNPNDAKAAADASVKANS